MKIVYGVVGEGMGHAIRSSVILNHLVAQGHEVWVMASGRAVQYLQERFRDVRAIHGFHIVYEENRVQFGKTFYQNMLAGTAAIPKQIAAYYSLLRDASPDAVITDFDSWTYLYSKLHRLPVMSLDNMQIINRCTHNDSILEGHRSEFKLTKAFIKSKLPFCDQYTITTFFRPPVRKQNTVLVSPVLRDEILKAKTSEGDHVVVYQTAEGYAGLAQILKETKLECRVYGMKRGLREELRDENLRFMPFSEAKFIEDLASARGVIAGGGFTLLSEAVYLHKPVLSVPVRGQFEQVMNGRYIQEMGYGQYAESLEDPEHIFSFLASVDRYRENLQQHQQDGNEEAFQSVDAFLDKVAADVI